MNTGKYGRSTATLKELLALDPQNMEARRLFATLHLKLGNLVTARQAFESLATEAIGRQDYWLAESLLQEYLAAGPRCIPFLELLAQVHQAKGDEIAAVRELGKAIEILRDDSDPEHQEKATQLYAKIRELAPVSPTAIELAPLFDVRTGEFLTPPQRTVAPPALSDMAEEPDQSGPAASLQSIDREFMFLELEEETAREGASPGDGETVDESSATTLEAELLPATDQSTVPLLTQEEGPTKSSLNAIDTHVGVTADDERSVVKPADSPASLLPKVEEPLSDQFRRRDDEPQTSDAADLGSSEETSAPGAEHALPHDVAAPASVTSEKELMSPIALGEGADVSVLIPEAFQSPISPDSVAPIEQTLPTERKENWSDPLDLSQEHPAFQTTNIDQPAAAMSFVPEDSQGLLPKPMPWEEEADASVEITEMEPSTVSAAGESQAAEDVEESGVHPIPPSSPEPASLAPSQTESPQSNSLSWDSIFDKAWKLATGVVSPGGTVVDEKPRPSPEGAYGTPLGTDDQSHTAFKEEESTTPPMERIAPGIIDEGTAVSLESVDHSAHHIPATSSEFPHQEVAGQPDLSSVDSTRTDESPFEAGPVEVFDQADAASDIESPFKLLQSMEIPLPVSTSILLADAVEEPKDSDLNRVSSESAEVEVSPAPTEPPPSSLDGVRDDIPPDEPGEGGEQARRGPEASCIREEAPESDATGSTTERLSHWDTGEVAIQLHRPTTKKKPWQKLEGQSEEDEPTALQEVEAESDGFSEQTIDPVVSSLEAVPPPSAEEVTPPGDTRPEWMQASDTITFARPIGSKVPQEEKSCSGQVDQSTDPSPYTVESAVDVLFASNKDDGPIRTRTEPTWSKPRPRLMAHLHRGRIAVTSFITSCFSTTRSLTVLGLTMLILSAGIATLGVGALSVMWMMMEQPPTQRFQNLTKNPLRTISDGKKNGYVLLMGFDAPAGQDPIQAGYERVSNGDTVSEHACLSGESIGGSSSMGASGHVVKGWFKHTDPVANIARQSDAVKSLAAHESLPLARYRQWLTMPFDDWGYGQGLTPNCSTILLAHRLFVAEGFSHGPVLGLDRLESDAQAWRAVLGQSKTLAVKMLAATALQDDVTTASSLLNQTELDATSLDRLSKIMRPLDQVELSLRWPMQSEFVLGTKEVPIDLKQDKSDDRPWYVSLVAAMKLPVQQRANAYAEYYEDSNRAMSEGRFTNLPKRSSYMRTSATALADYLANPIEHIVGIEPLPMWDSYVLRMVETDARLRLVGLQAWLRRSPNGNDVLTRLAKAGQAYYDPFTGFPMLINQQKRLIYSVGQDGKDQEGDPSSDIVVKIPSASP